jgi:hypothetical protein
VPSEPFTSFGTASPDLGRSWNLDPNRARLRGLRNIRGGLPDKILFPYAYTKVSAFAKIIVFQYLWNMTDELAHPSYKAHRPKRIISFDIYERHNRQWTPRLTLLRINSSSPIPSLALSFKQYSSNTRCHRIRARMPWSGYVGRRTRTQEFCPVVDPCAFALELVSAVRLLRV